MVQKRIPAVKRLYLCMENWWEADHPAGIQKPEDYSSASYITLLDRFLGIVGQAAKEYGVTPIIFYMPQTQIDRQGNYVDPTDEEARAAFASACEGNGICFVDMGEPFRELYESEHILAHGFINTRVGQGHLNKYGHEAVAATLADVIGRMEDAREAER